MAPRLLAIGLGMAVFGVRAWILPLQYDEGVTILNMHQFGLLSAFTRYADGTNNHVLFSLLVGIPVTMGFSHPLVLRLPSLLASLAVLLAAERIARPMGQLRYLFIIGIGLTPLFLDYLPMARGYPLGLALILWGIVFLGRPVVAGVLFGLAVGTVPTYAMDGVLLGIAAAFCGMKRRDILMTAGIAVGVAVVFYVPIFATVASTVISSAGGEGDKIAWLRTFAEGIGWHWTIGGMMMVIAAAVAVRERRGPMAFYAVSLLVFLPTIPLGFPRTRLLAAFLILLLLFYACRAYQRTVGVVIGIAALCLIVFPWDRIRAEPETWPVTGFAVARSLVPCLSVQKKGLFVIPHRFHFEIVGDGPDFNPNCTHALMVNDPAMGYPDDLRVAKDILDPYGVILYKQAEMRSWLLSKQQPL